MVIFPKNISNQDEDWVRACALMQVVPLAPRRPSRNAYQPPTYFESADEFLVRPELVVDRKRVPAPYFTYCLRFNISVSVHGNIDVNATEQIAEFKRAVTTALQGPLTVAERKHWMAQQEMKKYQPSDPTALALLAAARNEGQLANRFYQASVESTLEESTLEARATAGNVGASLSFFEWVLDDLIRVGRSLLQPA